MQKRKNNVGAAAAALAAAAAAAQVPDRSPSKLPRLFAMATRTSMLTVVALAAINGFVAAQESVREATSAQKGVMEAACPPAGTRSARPRSGICGWLSAVCSITTRGASASATLPEADMPAGACTPAGSERKKSCGLCGVKISSKAAEAHVREVHGRGVVMTKTFGTYTEAIAFLTGTAGFSRTSYVKRSTDDAGRVNDVAMCTERFICGSSFRGEECRARLAGARAAPDSTEAFGEPDIDTGIADSAAAAREREHARGLGFDGLKVHHGSLDCCAFATIMGPRMLLSTRSASARTPAIAMDTDRSDDCVSQLYTVTISTAHMHDSSPYFAGKHCFKDIAARLAHAALLDNSSVKASQITQHWSALCHERLGGIADAFHIEDHLVQHALDQLRAPKRHEQENKADTVLVTELLATSVGMAQTTQAVKLAGNVMFYTPQGWKPGNLGDGSSEAGAGAGAAGAGASPPQCSLEENALMALLVNPDVFHVLPYCDVIAVDHVFGVEASFSQLAVLLIMAVDRTGNAYSVATGIVSNKSASMTTAVIHELVQALQAHGVDWKPTYLLHDLCQTDFIGVKAAMPSLQKNIYCYWHRIAAAAKEVKKRVTKVIDAALVKALGSHEITAAQALELQRNAVFAQLVACWSTTDKNAAAAAAVTVCKYALEFPQLASWLKGRYQDDWAGAFNCLRDFPGARACNAICENFALQYRNWDAEYGRPLGLAGIMLRCSHILVHRNANQRKERLATVKRLRDHVVLCASKAAVAEFAGSAAEAERLQEAVKMSELGAGSAAAAATASADASAAASGAAAERVGKLSGFSAVNTPCPRSVPLHDADGGSVSQLERATKLISTMQTSTVRAGLLKSVVKLVHKLLDAHVLAGGWNELVAAVGGQLNWSTLLAVLAQRKAADSTFKPMDILHSRVRSAVAEAAGSSSVSAAGAAPQPASSSAPESAAPTAAGAAPTAAISSAGVPLASSVGPLARRASNHAVPYAVKAKAAAAVRAAIASNMSAAVSELEDAESALAAGAGNVGGLAASISGYRRGLVGYAAAQQPAPLTEAQIAAAERLSCRRMPPYWQKQHQSRRVGRTQHRVARGQVDCPLPVLRLLHSLLSTASSSSTTSASIIKPMPFMPAVRLCVPACWGRQSIIVPQCCGSELQRCWILLRQQHRCLKSSVAFSAKPPLHWYARRKPGRWT